MFELTLTCERCFQPIADAPGLETPHDRQIICGACHVAQELSTEQREALEATMVPSGSSSVTRSL